MNRVIELINAVRQFDDIRGLEVKVVLDNTTSFQKIVKELRAMGNVSVWIDKTNVTTASMPPIVIKLMPKAYNSLKEELDIRNEEVKRLRKELKVMSISTRCKIGHHGICNFKDTCGCDCHKKEEK